jgi:hypothetical protein
MNELIDNILTEWAYRVHDGMPNPKDSYHLVHLKESMKSLKVDGEVVDMVMNHLYEAKGDTSATTFYHEVITGIIVGGGSGAFNTGDNIKKYFDDGTIKAVNAGLGKVKPEGAVWERFLSSDSTPKSSIVSDAMKVGKSIISNLGKGKNMMWTGPTNDGSKFGAADIAGKFPGYGEVGISLKYGAGQLKNLTLGTFTKTLGLPSMTGTGFVKEYSSNFDALAKDWTKLVTSLFNSKSTDKNANKIFKKHIKSGWSAYQSEKISQSDLDTLTKSVGMNKIEQKGSKQKQFKYFCRKMQEKFHPQWKEWQTTRGKHFNNIFGTYLKKYDSQIRQNLSDLFKKELSVGDTSLFYAAKGGKTFWFIPSAKLYDKEMGPDEFIADYELQESQAGYKVFLDVGTQTAGGIGTIIIEIRFAMGQMDGTPDVKSNYKLVSKDWSGLLGKFRK